jgi:hypothetical protein
MPASLLVVVSGLAMAPETGPQRIMLARVFPHASTVLWHSHIAATS